MRDVRFIKIRNVLLWVLVFNWGVAAAKAAYGMFTRCASMSADGAHSFSDGASNLIGLVGIWVASRPIDKSHPYGHKKYETFAAIGIGVLLILLSLHILRDAFERFFNPVAPDVTAVSFIIMAVTLLINYFVMRHELKKSEELQSDILRSDALHTKSDILVSVSVICTLVSVWLGFPVIDAIVAVVIAFLIAHSAYEILKDSSHVLCDSAAVVSGSIKDVVMNIKGVQSCHKIRTRGRRDDVYVDMHVLVAPDMHVGAAHEVTEQIEREVKKRIPGVTDVVVHIEPSGSKPE